MLEKGSQSRRNALFYIINIDCIKFYILISVPFSPTDFSVCIQDPFVPPIRLDCRYLRDFEGTVNEDAKCGANGAKNETITIGSGFNITKFDFNCEKVRFEKAKPVTEPTES